MTRFRLASLAKTDLAEIRQYISRDKPLAAERQITAFFEKFHLLATHPELGQLQPELAGGDMRNFAAGNYIVFYRIIEDGIEVVRVVSGFRDLESLF